MLACSPTCCAAITCRASGCLTPAVEDSRAIAARRTALVHERTGIRNRIHSVLARRLIAAPAGDLFSGKGLTWLKHVDLDPLDRALVDADLRLLEALAASPSPLTR